MTVQTRLSGMVAAAAAALGLGLPTPAAAAAATQTAHSGDVTAKFSFNGSWPQYHSEHLTILQAGVVRYSAPVVSSSCTLQFPCAPASPLSRTPSVHVLDLEHNRSPDVMLDLFTGGAHCCFIEQIFSYDVARATYVMTERNFWDPGARIVDLGHNGRYELQTADEHFAYEWTSFAASGLPVQILTFSHRQFHNVTRRYPTVIAKDAAAWLSAFKGTAEYHWAESAGTIAAWAADEELLGHSHLVNTYLAQQAKAGHLKTSFGPEGHKFVASLMKFLRRYGYVS